MDILNHRHIAGWIQWGPVFRVWVWCKGPPKESGFTSIYMVSLVPQRFQMSWSAAFFSIPGSGSTVDPSGGPWMKSDIHSTKDKDRERKDKEKAGPAMCLCQLPGATFRKTYIHIYIYIHVYVRLCKYLKVEATFRAICPHVGRSTDSDPTWAHRKTVPGFDEWMTLVRWLWSCECQRNINSSNMSTSVLIARLLYQCVPNKGLLCWKRGECLLMFVGSI